MQINLGQHIQHSSHGVISHDLGGGIGMVMARRAGMHHDHVMPTSLSTQGTLYNQTPTANYPVIQPSHPGVLYASPTIHFNVAGMPHDAGISSYRSYLGTNHILQPGNNPGMIQRRHGVDVFASPAMHGNIAPWPVPGPAHYPRGIHAHINPSNIPMSHSNCVISRDALIQRLRANECTTEPSQGNNNSLGQRQKNTPLRPMQQGRGGSYTTRRASNVMQLIRSQHTFYRGTAEQALEWEEFSPAFGAALYAMELQGIKFNRVPPVPPEIREIL